MSGKTDVRVRARLTYSVTSYVEDGPAKSSQEIATGLRLGGANAIAKAVFHEQEGPGELTTLETNTAISKLAEGTWLHGAFRALQERPVGTLLLLELPDPSPDPTQEPTIISSWIEPEVVAAPVRGLHINPMAFGVADAAQALVDTVKDGVLREISRINLPERWEDLSRETTKRGLEAFMAIQMAGKEVWRDHEIEGLINRIALRTGKAKIDLRRMIESAQERVAEAQRGEQVRADLNVREEHYCRNRAKGHTPEQAARLAGYQPPCAAAAALLEANSRVTERIAELVARAKAEEDKTTLTMESGAVWEVPAEQAPANGSFRLDNATQEFFALNVGFYGMTVEAAAKQMSLPLPTADGLMEMPTVLARIRFFQRCKAWSDRP